MVFMFVPETNVVCFEFNAFWVAVLTGLLASEVLSTLPSPTLDLVNDVGLVVVMVYGPYTSLKIR